MRLKTPPSGVGPTVPSRVRGVYSPNNFVIVQTEHGTYARSWPRQATQGENAKKLASCNLFIERTVAMKKEDARAQMAAREMSQNTALLPRDVQMMVMANTAYQAFLLDGKIYMPMNTVYDVSDSLNIIGQVNGDLMIRRAGLWSVVPLGDPGEVLTCTGDDRLIDWAPGGGAGGAPYQAFAEVGNVSGSAFATKGNVFECTEDVPISGIMAAAYGVNAKNVRYTLCTFNALAVDAVLESVDQVSAAIATYQQLQCSFAATYTIPAGKRFAVLATYLSGTGTTPMGLCQVGKIVWGLPLKNSYELYARQAKNSVAVGDVFTFGTATDVPYAIWPRG